MKDSVPTLSVISEGEFEGYMYTEEETKILDRVWDDLWKEYQE